MKIGIQLYTLREESQKDFMAVLDHVADCGYDGVEFAGYYGHSPKELREHLDRLGLICCSTHTGWEDVFGHPEETIAIHQTLGCSHVIVPWYTLSSAADVHELAKKFNQVQSIYADNGMTLGYHNHSQEFQKDNGKYWLEILAEEAPGIELELDTFWSANGGADTRKFLLDYGSRISLIHLKDGNENGLQSIGEGDIDIQMILNTAKEIDAKWAIVENDDPKPDGFTDSKKSMDNLKSKFTF